MRKYFRTILTDLNYRKVQGVKQSKSTGHVEVGNAIKHLFLPSYEQNNFVLNPLADGKDPGQYSLSSFEKPKDVKRYAGVMSDMKVPYQIAVGETNPRHGVVQRTRERTKKKTSHVDWWLYRDATPYEEFSLIADFEKYLQDYNQERDDRK